MGGAGKNRLNTHKTLTSVQGTVGKCERRAGLTRPARDAHSKYAHLYFIDKRELNDK